MADLRIFSYLPNPRLYKATIAARLGGVDLEIRGATPKELAEWLWDFDARPLGKEDRIDKTYARRARAGFSGVLYKTDAFLAANPFGTVPVAFSPDGALGIFESNSMMRAVARLARNGPPLYGGDPYSAARIDSFLDVSLVFARDGQRYLFGLMGKGLTQALHDDMEKAFSNYLGGIEEALKAGTGFLVGAQISLADICFAAELVLFALCRSERERIEASGYQVIFDEDATTAYPRAVAHFDTLLAHPAFTPDLTPFYTD
ncbi:MAG TPA: glutathione S-transferase family protein, partial [Gammaproteobacteria bacterium]|nr:glutathione S-transferase family protein [Gammaproteobacteria bacterium]